MEGDIHIYCINLKHRQDRWQRFMNQPELAVLTKEYGFERFEGINGSALDIQSDSRISLRTKRNIKDHVRRDHEELDSAGGVGCYLSHVAVWENFLKRPEPYAIILEDDALIPDGFLRSLKRAMKQTTLLAKQPDVWYFSEASEWYFKYKGKPLPQNVKGQKVGPWIIKSCAAFTGYLITKRGAEQLLKTAFPIDMHVDLYSCLAGELGEIFTVANENVTIRPYSLKEADTDIQVSPDCPICDVPTQYRRKGMIVVSLPLVAVWIGVAGTLWWMARSGGRRR